MTERRAEYRIDITPLPCWSEETIVPGYNIGTVNVYLETDSDGPQADHDSPGTEADVLRAILKRLAALEKRIDELTNYVEQRHKKPRFVRWDGVRDGES